MKKLYTERFGLTQPRVNEKLSRELALGLLGMIKARIDENWFGLAYPAECQDGGRNRGCDVEKLKSAFVTYDLIWPEDLLENLHGRARGTWVPGQVRTPTEADIFDLIEFSYEKAALPESYDFHSYFSHEHFSYDKEKGRAQFVEDINQAFARHGMIFELVDGEVTRMAPTGLHEALAESVFRTGDASLDRLLVTAREKFLHRSLDVRKESLEKLWDAWERLKTLESGKDKKARATTLLDKAASEPNFRQVSEDEARYLTSVGNNFMIRHTEVDKVPVTESAHVDYLFHRLFAMIQLLLKGSGRLSRNTTRRKTAKRTG